MSTERIGCSTVKDSKTGVSYSYEIFTTFDDPAQISIAHYAGDILLYLDNTRKFHSVHLYQKGSGWHAWNTQERGPEIIMNRTAFIPWPDSKTGLRYVRADEGMPVSEGDEDRSSERTALRIAQSVGWVYDDVTQPETSIPQRKRAGTVTATSPPAKGKRLRRNIQGVALPMAESSTTTKKQVKRRQRPRNRVEVDVAASASSSLPFPGDRNSGPTMDMDVEANPVNTSHNVPNVIKEVDPAAAAAVFSLPLPGDRIGVPTIDMEVEANPVNTSHDVANVMEEVDPAASAVLSGPLSADKGSGPTMDMEVDANPVNASGVIEDRGTQLDAVVPQERENVVIGLQKTLDYEHPAGSHRDTIRNEISMIVDDPCDMAQVIEDHGMQLDDVAHEESENEVIQSGIQKTQAYERLMNHKNRRTRRLSWRAHGVATDRPRTCEKDMDAVRLMAAAPKAMNVKHHYPLLVELMNPPSSSRSEMSRTIQDHLSQGTAVLVRGWEPRDLVELTLDEVSMYRHPITEPVQWQDAHLRARIFKQDRATRDYNSQLVDGTLREFVAALDDPSRCLNCLDLPNITPEIPNFVRHIMDDANAFMASGKESYIDKNGKSGNGTATGLIGPQFMHVDGLKANGWDVMTHPCFLTYPHHDAGGYLTFSYIRSGSKMWAYLDLAEVDEEDQTAVIQGWDDYYADAMACQTFRDNVKVGSVLLEKGTVLIQPPGANHMVYTPQPAIMSGGHFLSYDTMHLTEFSLSFDLGRDVNWKGRMHASNSSHPGVLRKVYRMVIALPIVVKCQPWYYKRCIIAMASILHIPQMKLKDDEHARPGKEFSGELEAERKRARLILDPVLKQWGIQSPQVEMRKGLWRDPGARIDLSLFIQPA